MNTINVKVNRWKREKIPRDWTNLLRHWLKGCSPPPWVSTPSPLAFFLRGSRRRLLPPLMICSEMRPSVQMREMWWLRRVGRCCRRRESRRGLLPPLLREGWEMSDESEKRRADARPFFFLSTPGPNDFNLEITSYTPVIFLFAFRNSEIYFRDFLKSVSMTIFS